MPSAIGSAPSAEVDVDLRLPLLEQDLRRIRLLERQILQVDALDLEHGGLGVVGHGSSRQSKREPAGRRASAGAAATIGRAPADYRVPASSGTRPPRRSSATRSSQPPTWVSPMKICGTVRRPVSCDHRVALGRVAGRPGSRRSPRRRAASAAPWRARQYGQIGVVYIFDRACMRRRVPRASRSGRFSIGRLASRQALEAAGQRARVLEAELLQQSPTARGARARSGRPRTSGSALFFGRSRDVSRLAERHAARADGMAGGVLGRLADVDQHRLLAVDQAHRVGRVDRRRRRRASLSSRPEQQAARDERRRANRYQLSRTNFTVMAARAPGRAKRRIIEFALLRAARGASPHSHRAAAPPAMHKLVLLRHGESTWNLENRFTGWTDVDLTPTGVEQARAGRPAAEGRRATSSTSPTPRCSSARSGRCGTRSTRWTAPGCRCVNDWRLNERHYGALQGLNKAETAASTATSRCWSGAAATTRRRRALDADDPRSERSDPRYAELAPGAGAAHRMPEGHGRARAAVLERRRSRRRSRAGQRLLIAAHGNSMRALVKYLDGISDDDDRRPQHPERHPAGLRARRRAEADPQLLPRRRRSGGARRPRRSRTRARPR